MHMCRAFFHQATMGKSKQKVGKTQNILGFKKVTQLVLRALVAVKKQKITKSKTTTLTYFDKLKKKQQDQDGRNWYYTQGFATENLKFQN